MINFDKLWLWLIHGDRKWVPNLCYGQYGEDLTLDGLLGGQKIGFFVDIGAHHPARFSNTLRFYKRGWRGINVDANPGSMTAFKKCRPRDINIECGVAQHAGELTYFQFNEPALNTFNKNEASSKSAYPYKIINQILVPVIPLAKILEENLPIGQKIHFMTIDVEGEDLAVLKSNDWSRFRPSFVLVETLHGSLSELNECEVSVYLKAMNYFPVAKIYKTMFYSDAQI